MGFGIISKKSFGNQIPILNLLFLIILFEENGHNSETELKKIFKIKDLKKYLVDIRRVKFDENFNSNINDIYEEDTKIGFFYNIDNFNLEIYLKRNESQKIENSLKEL